MPMKNLSLHQTTSQSRILTLAEAAEVLRCSKAHLSNVLNGHVASLPPLPQVCVGRRKLIRRDSLDEWLGTVEAQSNRASGVKSVRT